MSVLTEISKKARDFRDEVPSVRKICVLLESSMMMPHFTDQRADMINAAAMLVAVIANLDRHRRKKP
jgi:hypothetical protein